MGTVNERRRRMNRRIILLAVVALAALMTVGATAASAHKGRGGGFDRASASALVTESAKQLSVTRAKLVEAIETSAVARIDEAVEDGDIESDDASDLKDEARDNLRFALATSRTRTVASNLGITAERLNTGFRAARKALVVRRIDDAVDDGDLEAEKAAELKEELDDVDLPGYQATGFGRPGLDRGLGRGGSRR